MEWGVRQDGTGRAETGEAAEKGEKMIKRGEEERREIKGEWIEEENKK